VNLVHTHLIVRRWLFPSSIACALVAGASAQQPDSRTLVLSSRTDLVVLPVTVLDRGGRRVPGLTPTNFAVYENDVLQPVTFFMREDSPATVGLVIDNSGSMRNKRDQVIAGGLVFAGSSNPSDELFTVNFNEHVWTGLPPGVPFTDDREQLRLALSTMKTDGLTALYDATIAALDQIEAGTTMRKALIIVSDGGDNASQQSLAAVTERARRADVTIYTVGVIDEEDEDADRGVLKQLARLTGGEAYFPDRIGDVTQVFERIATQIRAGYTLGYVSPEEPRDGSFRRIHVTVNSPQRQRLNVRTRTGYMPRQ
jgi:Ca-activated chloride channel family protein